MKMTRSKITAALAAAFCIVSLAITGCVGSGPDGHAAQSGDASVKKSETIQYTCSMHPEVVQDKPGDCPKCGMKLVEKR